MMVSAKFGYVPTCKPIWLQKAYEDTSVKTQARIKLDRELTWYMEHNIIEKSYPYKMKQQYRYAHALYNRCEVL